MLGVEIAFGNKWMLSDTSSYKPTNAKTPARTQGFFSFRWWPGAESTWACYFADAAFGGGSGFLTIKAGCS
jgi:hypothetical protein